MTRKQLINTLGLKIFGWGEKYLAVPSVELCERRGAKLGDLHYRLDKKHRERALANVRMIFPELDEAAHQKMVRDMFRHFGMTTADFIRSTVRTNEELLASITPYGAENFDVADAYGKGVLAVTAHLGNWERFGHWCLAKGRAITSVARDADDGTIQAKINDLRTHNGMQVISRGNAIRQILAKLKTREMIGILPDQNADEAYIPFFNRTAGTVLGPAVLHLRTGAPILPCCCLRVGVGRYEVHVREPMVAMPGESPEELMTRVNLQIEQMIRMRPEQYLWMHDRWKNARNKGLL